MYNALKCVPGCTVFLNCTQKPRCGLSLTAAGLYFALLLQLQYVFQYAVVTFEVILPALVNEDIRHLVRARAALSIGERTAEDIKMTLASALPAREITSAVIGLDMATGFPGEREIRAYMISEAVAPVVDALALAITENIQDTPEDLSADLTDAGITLTGGGALLSGLDKVLAARTGLDTHLPETPSLCTGKGMARILQDPELSEMTIERI